MNAPALSLRGLVKRYGAATVLDGVDLEVPAGSCFALVGANGAGKTTCIKILLDFVAAHAGSVRIFGRDHREPRARTSVVFLPERFQPPYHLTGFEFLAYTTRLHGGHPRRAAACEAAARLELATDALQRPARSYSKGMAQKLGLVSCLLSGKDLLVLDEPMSGLDPKARSLVKRLMSELNEQGRTLFYSTHVLSDVQAVSDGLAILDRGRVRFCGSPQECLQRFGGRDLEQAYLNCINA